VKEARLAQVAPDYGGLALRADELQGGDGQLGIVPFETVNGRKIGHQPARSAICSGIVETPRH
jgi:hypothetical protein